MKLLSLAVVALVALLVSLTLAQTRYLHIAEFATDSAHLDEINPGGKRIYSPADFTSLRNGYRLWADTVNANGGIVIGNETYQVNLTEHFIGDCSNAVMIDYAEKVVNEVALGMRGPVDVFFGPYGSGLTNVTMTALEKHKKLMIAAASTSSANLICNDATFDHQPPCTRGQQRPRFQYLYAISGAAGNLLKTSMQFVSVRRDVKTVAFWKEEAPFLQDVVATASSVARQANLNIISDVSIPLSPSYEVVKEVALNLKKLNPDVILSGNQYGSCKHFVTALKEVDYVPKALIMPLCIDVPTVAQDLGNLTEYLLGAAQWDRRLTGVSYEDQRYFLPSEGKGSSQIFYDAYMTKYGLAPSVFSALAVQAGYTLQEIIDKTRVIDTETWVTNMITVQFNCFFGAVQFNGYHQNIGAQSITLQQINGQLEIVDPLSAATAVAVYPIPPWKDRIFHSVYLGTTMETSIFAVGLVIAALLIAFLIIMIVKRKAAVISAASPVFLGLIALGSLLPILGVYSWMLHNETVLCHLRIWFFNIGFSLVYGAIFTKTWRVFKIFMNKSLKTRNISLREILTIEAVIVGVDIVICLVWSIVARPTAKKIIVDATYESRNYIECVPAEPVADMAMFAICAAYKLLILFVGVVLTFRVRKVKYLLFNESRWISYAIYNMFIFLCVLIPLQFMSTERVTLYFIRSIFTLLIVLTTNLLIFAPKLYILFGPAKGGTILMSAIQANSEIMTVADGGMGQTIVDDKGGDNVEKLHDEIAELKKKVKRQARRIRDLTDGNPAQSEKDDDDSDLEKGASKFKKVPAVHFSNDDTTSTGSTQNTSD